MFMLLMMFFSHVLVFFLAHVHSNNNALISLFQDKLGKWSEEWNCSECKVCSVCEEEGQESKLMFCDCCDRAFHTYCLNPPMRRVPEGSWMCDECDEA